MTIYLTRHGESLANIKNIIGDNYSLSKKGYEYSKKLYTYFESENLIIYTSSLKRTKETGHLFNNPIESKLLDEINAGIFENKTFDEFKLNYPNEYQKRQKNKLFYKYKKGESYIDLIIRVNKFLQNIDLKKDILIICHRAILRTLLHILCGIEKFVHLDIPLNTIYKIKNKNYELIKLE